LCGVAGDAAEKWSSLMMQFAAFAFYLCLSATLLIVAPVMMHPTLPMKRKLLITAFSFLILVPIGLALYAWLGAPTMAVSG
ncbi:MAG: hypothetical protein ACOYNL_01485, partial [Rickettsiales bacterium]